MSRRLDGGDTGVGSTEPGGSAGRGSAAAGAGNTGVGSTEPGGSAGHGSAAAGAGKERKAPASPAPEWGMTSSGVPAGYRTLSPYLVVEDAEGLLAFVSTVFGSVVRRRMTGEAGGLHGELELGDSVLMAGEGGGMRFPAMLHVYVEDADAVYERALAEGATSAAEPHDTSFGDHRAAFDDRWGNQWWIATRRETPVPQTL